MSPTPGKRVMDRTLWTALQRALGNDYEILRELTGAGMSRVFVAREIHLHRDVVVKVLPPDLAAGIKTERFEREIQFAARLQHPHIVPLLSAGSHEGLLYYTMPFVQRAIEGRISHTNCRRDRDHARRRRRSVICALAGCCTS